jgi:hypothetical protein
MKPAFYPGPFSLFPSLSFCEIVVKGDGILLDKDLSKNEKLQPDLKLRNQTRPATT